MPSRLQTVLYRGGWKKACLGTTNPALRTPSHSWECKTIAQDWAWRTLPRTEPGVWGWHLKDLALTAVKLVGGRAVGPWRYNFLSVVRELEMFIFALSSQEPSKRQNWGHGWYLQLSRYGMDWETMLCSAQRVGAAWSEACTLRRVSEHTYHLSCMEHAWLWELGVWLWIWDRSLSECQGVEGSAGCVGVCTEKSLWRIAMPTLSCSASPFFCGPQSQCRLSIFGSTVLAVSWRHRSDVDHETEPLGCCALWNSGCQLSGYGRSASLQGPNVDSSLARDSIFLTPVANCHGFCSWLSWSLRPGPEEASSPSAEDRDRQGEIDEGSLVF